MSNTPIKNEGSQDDLPEADAFPLSSEAFHLLRSLPRWNGPSVTGAVATEATDDLCRMGLAVGSLASTDRPFDEDDEDPRAWRTMAGDVLLATVGAMQTPEAIALSRSGAVSAYKPSPPNAPQPEKREGPWKVALNTLEDAMRQKSSERFGADHDDDDLLAFADELQEVLFHIEEVGPQPEGDERLRLAAKIHALDDELSHTQVGDANFRRRALEAAAGDR